MQDVWVRLPEPIDTSADPALGAERRKALSFAVLLLLEKCSPKERAAYILREAFNYQYREIADIIRVEEANARQLVTRARQHVSDGRQAPANPAEQRQLRLDCDMAVIREAQHLEEHRGLRTHIE